MVTERVMQERDEEFRSIGSGDEGEARLGNSAHLIERPILHCVLRGDDVVAEIAAQPFTMFF